MGENGKKMSLRSVGYVFFCAGLVPVVAFGSIAYVPSRPCCYVMNGCTPVYPKLPYGYNNNCCNCNSQDVENYCGEQEEQPKEPLDSTFYIAANVMMNMWSWKNEYESDYGGVLEKFNSDKYSFESVWGGSLALGARFSSGWRSDVELGVMSDFSDSDDFVKFTLSIPYVMANVYYDFDSGFYVGAGLGIARPTISLEGEFFNWEGAENSEISPKVGVAFGYAAAVSDNTFIDFRYRLSGIKGTHVTNSTFLWDQYINEYEEYSLKITNGFIMENSISVGIRFNF